MENFELIEKYLMGRMSTEEKVAFEDRLNHEPDLRTEKESMAEMILGVESLHLKNKLKDRKIGDQKKSQNKVVDLKPKSAFSFQKLAIAASIAAVFFCGWWFMKPTMNSDDQLFAQAFSVDQGLPTPMSESTNYSFYDGMVEYKMENYDKAIEQWTSSSESIGKDTLGYYLGMAYMNQNKNTAAIQKLESIANESAFAQKAQWYLVSLLIKEQNYAEAKKRIKNIPSSIHPKYEEVKKLLEKK